MGSYDELDDLYANLCSHVCVCLDFAARYSYCLSPSVLQAYFVGFGDAHISSQHGDHVPLIQVSVSVLNLVLFCTQNLF